jgi:hypothetical protein
MPPKVPFWRKKWLKMLLSTDPNCLKMLVNFP